MARRRKRCRTINRSIRPASCRRWSKASRRCAPRVRRCRRCNAPAAARADAEFLLAIKEHDFTEATIRAAGVVVDPLADTETVDPGGSIDVNVRVFLAQPSLATVTSACGQGAGILGCESKPAIASRSKAARGRRELPNRSARFAVSVPATAAVTQPYFLEQATSGRQLPLAARIPEGRPIRTLAAAGRSRVEGR